MATPWEGGVSVAPARLPTGITVVLFLLRPEAGSADHSIEDREPSGLDRWRLALLVNALASSRLEELASQEALQPPSLYPRCPARRLTCAAALVGGALAALPADDGRALVALTRGREMTVAYEMAEGARQAGLEGSIKIARPATSGACVL